MEAINANFSLNYQKYRKFKMKVVIQVQIKILKIHNQSIHKLCILNVVFYMFVIIVSGGWVMKSMLENWAANTERLKNTVLIP